MTNKPQQAKQVLAKLLSMVRPEGWPFLPVLLLLLSLLLLLVPLLLVFLLFRPPWFRALLLLAAACLALQAVNWQRKTISYDVYTLLFFNS